MPPRAASASQGSCSGSSTGTCSLGTLADGTFDQDACTVECPRHGSLFDIRTGKPKTLPAYVPVETFDVRVEDDMIKLEVE